MCGAGVLNAESRARAAFTEAVKHSLGAALHVPQGQISVSAVSSLPASSLSTSSRRLLLATAPAAELTGLLNVSAVLRPPYGSMPYPRVLSILEAYSAKSARRAGFKQLHVLSVLQLSAAGIAGNGVCELGEMPTPASRGNVTIPAYCAALCQIQALDVAPTLKHTPCISNASAKPYTHPQLLIHVILAFPIPYTRKHGMNVHLSELNSISLRESE